MTDGSWTESSAVTTISNVAGVPDWSRYLTRARTFPLERFGASSKPPVCSTGCTLPNGDSKVEFPVAIHKDPDSCYGVTVPDIPGVFSAGDTVDEAMKNTREAIYSHVSILIEDGLDVSLVPSPIGDLIPNPDYAGAIWAYVEVDLSKLDSRPER